MVRGSACVSELRALMEEVQTAKSEREVMESTLRDPIADIGELASTTPLLPPPIVS